MRLISCYIEGFGKLRKISVDFQDGLNCLVRENGWGKSTFAAFIRVMFYGFEGETRRNSLANERLHYYPWTADVYGGEIVFETADRRYRLQRVFDVKRKGDRFALYDAVTNMPSNDFSDKLGEELFQIDAESFQYTVYIGQDDCDTSMTDCISSRLGNVQDETKDMNNYDKACLALKSVINTQSPSRKTGELYKHRNEIAVLKEKVRNIGALEDELDEVRIQRRNWENPEVIESARRLESLRVKADTYALTEDELANYKLLMEKYFPEKSGRQGRVEFPTDQELDNIAGLIGDICRYRQGIESVQEQIADAKAGVAEKDVDLREIQEKEQDAAQDSERIPEGKADKSGVRIVKNCIILSFVWAMVFLCLKIIGIIDTVAMTVILVAGISVIIAIGVLIFRKWVKLCSDDEEFIEIKNTDERHAREEKFTNSNNILKDMETKLLRYEQNMDICRENISDICNNYEMSFNIETMHSRELYRAVSEIRQLKRQSELLLAREKIINEYKIIKTDILKKISDMGISLDGDILGGLIEKKNRFMTSCDMRIAELTDRLTELKSYEVQLAQLQSEYEEDMKRYEIVQKTYDLLGKAKSMFTARYTSPVMKAFEKYYLCITGKNQDMQINSDMGIYYRSHGMYRDKQTLSAGLLNLTNVCLRAALVDVMYSGEKPVLIMDDPFVNLDDHNMEGAKKLLTFLEEKYQIIYFTCSQNRVL